MENPPPVLPDGFNAPEPGTKDPSLLLEETLSGQRRFQVLVAACRLGIFTQCATPRSVNELCTTLRLLPLATELFLNALVAQQLLEKDGENYRNTPYAGRYLNSASPYCLQDQINLQIHLAGLWTGLEDVLKTGPKVYNAKDWFSDLVIPAMAANARCGILQRTVGLVSSQPEFQSAKKLLDMGGGHGLYTIAFCQQNPSLHGVVFDLPGVLPATRRYIDHYKADRVSCVPGNFFSDPLGEGFDIVFSSSNPGGKAPALIPKIRDALKPGGLFINKQGNDTVLTDPLQDLEWNLWTVEGMQKNPRQYSFSYSLPFADYNRRLADEGFTVRAVLPISDQASMTIARKND